jgi:TetR/AcrR family transcriptional regulator, transcriptional repressor for nem operon
MPRPRTHSRKSLISDAMMQFWRHGFAATSMDDLVRSTGVSRHGIYSEVSGKDALFSACLNAYRDEFVTPAFVVVEQSGATLDAVMEFFNVQIGRGEAAGLLGLGCLMANTMTEVAPHDDGVRRLVEQHNERLRSGFRLALKNSVPRQSQTLDAHRLDRQAIALVVFANGLWSFSRSTTDPSVLRGVVREMLQLVQRRLEE